MLRWFSLPAVSACFELGPRQLGGHWVPTTDHQKKFIERLFPSGKELLEHIDPEELDVSASSDGMKLFLKATVKAEAIWTFPGEEVGEPEFHRLYRNHHEFIAPHALTLNSPQNPYPWVFSTHFEEKKVDGLPHEVFKLETKDDKDQIYFTSAVFEEDQEANPFELWARVVSIAEQYKYAEETHTYNGIYFPKISIDVEESVPWPKGFQLSSPATKKWLEVEDAQQALKLEVDHLGFYEESKFEMTLSCSGPSEYGLKFLVLNGPITYWRVRNSRVMFCAIIGPEYFKDPKRKLEC